MQVLYCLDLWISFSGVAMGWHGWQNAKGRRGAPASKLKTLKIYLSANCHGLNKFIVFSLFNENSQSILSLIHLTDRPACSELPLDTYKFTI
jgi:hypothetical protein